jgi:large subunit ribosomal protein L18Ae
VPASACKRANTLQFHDSKIKFPLTHNALRPSSKVFKTLYKAKRPNVALF